MMLSWQIEDYDKKYEGLPKLFHDKKFFEEFAQKHNMRIEFSDLCVPGYWNNDFVFNCCMYSSAKILLCALGAITEKDIHDFFIVFRQALEEMKGAIPVK